MFNHAFRMNDTPQSSSFRSSVQTIDRAVHVSLVFLLAGLCLWIFRPFALPFAWGTIIAIGAYPIYLRINKALGGRRTWSGVVYALLGLALIVGPSILLAETLIEGAQAAKEYLDEEVAIVPPPPKGVQELPLIGKQLYEYWSLASSNLEEALNEVSPQIAAAAGMLLGAAAGIGVSILQFIIAVIIAAALSVRGESNVKGGVALATRLIGDQGPGLAELVGVTIRNVATGILGVAAIQTLMAGVGFLAVGLPAAGLWALFCLVLSIIQIGPALIVIPAVIYVFSTASTTTAVLFLLWSIVVLASDNFLKPLLMGRGAKVPILVIFLGAIGGFIAMGIIGLFIGSIVLSLGYELYLAWLHNPTRLEETPA